MTPRCEERSPPCRRAAGAMPGRSAIDWSAHFRAVIDDLESMQRSVEREDEDPDLLTLVLCMRMRRVALRLRSRHLPQTARSRFSQIPWRGIAAWLAREEALERAAIRPLRRDVALIDFARTARSLIAPIRDLQRELAMTSAHGNERDGILAWEERAGFACLTLRLPADRTGPLLAALKQAYEGVEPPTLEGVRTALATISDALTALGVRRLRLIGSVACGTATAASDVDLLYDATPTDNAWRVWCDLLALLERTLGCVVDLHEAAWMPTRSRAGAITVWQQDRSRRRGVTTARAKRRARSTSGGSS